VDELALDTVTDRTVADVMMTRPKTLRADATVADARAVFTNPKVQTCPILGDDGRLLGDLAREQVPGAEADDEPARLHADDDPPTIRPGASMQEAIDRLRELESERLCVIDADRRLLGLLCLNGRHSAFCTDKA
jgi:CBS domain-containing protein